MYSVDGDFGQVRMITQINTSKEPDGFFSFSTLGWHRCNEKYRITRPNGEGVDYLLLVTIQGRGCLQFGGNEYTLNAGSIALVPRGIPNSYFTPKGSIWEFYWIHPQGLAAQTFLDTLCDIGTPCCIGVNTAKFPPIFEHIMTIFRERPADYRLQISRQISNLLHLAGLELVRGNNHGEIRLSERVISCIEQNYASPITIESIAKELFLSTSHLIREFRREMGYTPHAYLTEYRIANAEQLLRFTAMSVDDIASRTGFCSASHLINAFHKSRGMTPAAYRRKSRQ